MPSRLLVILGCGALVAFARAIAIPAPPSAASPCPLPVDLERLDESVPEAATGIRCLVLPESAASLAAAVCNGDRPVSGILHAGRLLLLSCARPEESRLVGMRRGARLALGLPTDLDEAEEADLLALPGVGPALARRILAARAARPGGRFARVDELEDVQGIGPATYARLAPLVDVAPVQPDLALVALIGETARRLLLLFDAPREEDPGAGP